MPEHVPLMPKGMQEMHDAAFSYDLEHADQILPDVVSFGEFNASQKNLESSELAREQLEKISKIDSMTGLKNKDALNAYLPQLVVRHERNLGFLFIDGNEFKQINDLLSYDHGNNFIQRLGHMIDDHIDKHARTGVDEAKTEAFRWGGDEFVVILHDIDSPEQLDTIGKRLTGFFRGGNEDNGAVIPTISIGSAFIGPEADDSELRFALADAETAMKYTKLQSKLQGEQQHTKISTLFHTNIGQEKTLQFSPSSYARYQESTLGAFTALFKQTSLLAK